MAIFIQCPDCREKYKFENVHGGKNLACKCGRKLEIPPAAEDGSDIKECPFCNALGAPDAVICVGCGYNFNTGKKIKAPAEDEPEEEQGPSTMQKLIPIIKFVVAPLVILIVGFLIYSSVTGKSYGISKTAPLGVFDRIDREFIEIKLVKDAETKPIPKDFGVEGKIYTYVDEILKKRTKGFTIESISVAVDAQNRVVGFYSTFYPPGEGIPTTGSKVYLRMLGFWKDEMELPKSPDFKTQRVGGDGRLGYNMDVANVENNVVKAQWSKEPGPTALQASTDMIIVSLKEFKVEKLAMSPEQEAMERVSKMFDKDKKDGADAAKDDDE
ncbi:MAG TPA: hypothetical protein DET40_14860 [Lentisphaeria bacterium]|nr:MAG: hypothetical protein A2X45_06135 [Lentisphaerae bacterium GWF2_50_93]HCE44818.1 hypothetical protein [Lentisphaeria bacterium]